MSATTKEQRPLPSPDRYLDDVFGERGVLAGAFAGYRPRPGQIALARAVDSAIVRRSHLLSEAGTGTGKSVGYSVPATYHAAAHNKTAILVTANIALQEQLIDKDLPLLSDILPWNFTYAILKGRNNFMCLDKLEDYELRIPTLPDSARRDHSKWQDSGRDTAAKERVQLPIVYDWAVASRAAPENNSGDVSELPFEPTSHVWREFSVSSDECLGDKCAHKEACFANRAIGHARASQIVVTNYHILCADLAVYAQTDLDLVVPAFDVCILDEAQKCADIARDFFGAKVTQEAARRVVRRLRHSPSGHIVAQNHDRACVLFFSLMGALKRDKDRYKARIRDNLTLDERDAWNTLEGSFATAIADLDRYVAATTGHPRECAGASRDLRRAKEILAALQRAMAPAAKGARVVSFLDEDDKTGKITIANRLVYASDPLTPLLYGHTRNSRKESDDYDYDLNGPTTQIHQGPRVSVIATSATLATDTGFSFAASELGTPPGYDTLVAESPFDWERQCLFVVPDGMPEPNSKEFADIVAQKFEQICDLAGGRTLGLFTSRRVLNHVYDRIAPTIGKRYTLLRQGDAPKTKLIAQFKEDITSVLLGNESFWAGVDVPGEALSCVVIDRLPFPTPDDPVLDALSAQDDRWFFKYSVPRAIVQFRQAVGRLIRSNECKGVIVCLDCRLVTKRYGKQFLRSIPAEIPKSTRLEAIREFLTPPDPDAWAEL